MYEGLTGYRTSSPPCFQPSFHTFYLHISLIGSSTGSGFTFGAQATQPSTQTQGLSFGASTFGTAATTTTASTGQTTGFTLGAASQPQTLGAGAAAGTVKFAASPFSFGGQSTSSAPTLGAATLSGTALGAQATSTSGTSGFTFGATAVQPAGIDYT